MQDDDDTSTLNADAILKAHFDNMMYGNSAALLNLASTGEQSMTTTQITPTPSPAAQAFVDGMVKAKTAGKALMKKSRKVEPTVEDVVPEPTPAAKPAAKRRTVGDFRKEKAAKAAQDVTPTPAATKPAKATKPTPAATEGSPEKFVQAFTRTFQTLLGSHGYKAVVTGKEPRLITFASDDIKVELTNPGKAGGSAAAPYSVTRKSGKVETGAGRNALADLLGIPRLAR